jgi:hypothetical protein
MQPRILTGTTDPTSAVKSPAYNVSNGDIWYNSTNSRVWICVDAGSGTWFRNDSVKTIRKTVDASAGGTAQTTAIATIPAGAIIHEVVAHAEVAFNGDTTKTLEVGVAGNADKYIDATNFDAGTLNDWQAMTGGGANDQGTAEYCTAAVPIIATWTNTANATAGTVEVLVTYSDVMT